MNQKVLASSRALCMMMVLLLLFHHSAGAQVEGLDEKIDTARKTDLRVIVLDAQGKAVSGAAVKIEQLRHDFTIGFLLSEQGFGSMMGDEPVLRCFNAVSLEKLTSWSKLQPLPLDEPDFSKVEAAVETAQRLGLRLRWGGVISADIGRNPDWVAFLEGPKLAASLDHYLKAVLLQFGRRVDAFDLYTHNLDHHFVEDRLGIAMVRQMYEHAHAAAPRTAIALRFQNNLSELRLKKSMRHVRQMKQQFIPFAQVSISQHIGGILLQRQLAHDLQLLGELAREVVISSLEVGGSSDAAAANNLETLLHILFATESVRGIYFSGLTAEQVSDANAALLDNAGHPTRAGEAVDKLFHERWWTDEAHATDMLGNVYARVFAGTHRITAMQRDGSTLQTTVYLSHQPPPDLASHVVVLEPMKSP